jgi:EAL domain-containing protein (putative c-di-GMP-specific phosphodiesterase class I)
MEVIAEGVETRAQADALRALRCRRGQGFLFSEPLAADEAEALLAGGFVKIQA